MYRQLRGIRAKAAIQDASRAFLPHGEWIAHDRADRRAERKHHPV